MANWVYKALFVATLSMSLEAAASSEKIYISGQNVVFRDKQILIQVGNDVVPIRNLSTDELGIYIYSQDLPVGFWVCDNGHTNYPWDLYSARQGL